MAKGSLGIGGHMNDGDEHLFALDREAYNEAVQREVAEEVRLETKYTNHVVALINDDSTEVGRVHLGVVHIFQLETDAARKREAQITEAGFLTADELRARRDALETWSQFCLDGLDQLLAAAQVTMPMEIFEQILARRHGLRRLGYSPQDRGADHLPRRSRSRACRRRRRRPRNGSSASSNQIVPPHLRERLEHEHEVDFAYAPPQLGRFRVNVFQQRGDFVLAMRLVKSAMQDFGALNLPTAVRKIADTPRGIVLIAGATGSGKSTTLAAMIEHINQTARKHIITLEDPIEYLFTDRMAIIEQREVGLDTDLLRERAEERAASGPGRARHRRNARLRRASRRRSARRTSGISSSPPCTPRMRPKACSASSNFSRATIANPPGGNSRPPCTRSSARS